MAISSRNTDAVHFVPPTLKTVVAPTGKTYQARVNGSPFDSYGMRSCIFCGIFKAPSQMEMSKVMRNQYQCIGRSCRQAKAERALGQ